MKPVRTQPKFQCDHCKRRSTRSVMEKHEKRCFRNPNRFCDNCQNTGIVIARRGEFGMWIHRGTPGEACPYCAKFNAQQLREIEEREAAA